MLQELNFIGVSHSQAIMKDEGARTPEPPFHVRATDTRRCSSRYQRVEGKKEGRRTEFKHEIGQRRNSTGGRTWEIFYCHMEKRK